MLGIFIVPTYNHLGLQRSDSVAEILPYQLLPKEPRQQIAGRGTQSGETADEGNSPPHTKQSASKHVLHVHACVKWGGEVELKGVMWGEGEGA